MSMWKKARIFSVAQQVVGDRASEVRTDMGEIEVADLLPEGFLKREPSLMDGMITSIEVDGEEHRIVEVLAEGMRDERYVFLRTLSVLEAGASDGPEVVEDSPTDELDEIGG